MGLVGAAVYYFSVPKIYASHAKLMVRYVVDRSAVDQVDHTAPTGRAAGEQMIQSEMEILTSWDLAEDVAVLCRMDGLVPNSKEPPESASMGARVIAEGLTVSARSGNVILVSFRHENPVLARTLLDRLIQRYFVRHLEIHRSKEAAKFVTEKVEQQRTKLRGTEEELTRLKTDNGILTVEGAMTAKSEAILKAQSTLDAVEAQLAGQRARVAILERLGIGGEGSESASAASAQAKSTGNARPLRFDLVAEKAELAAIEATSEKLKESLAAARKAAATLTGVMPRIAERELARDILEANYKSMAARLEAAQIDEALDPSKIPNISIVQEATPADLDIGQRNKTTMKIALAIPVATVVLVLLFGTSFQRNTPALPLPAPIQNPPPDQAIS